MSEQVNAPVSDAGNVNDTAGVEQNATPTQNTPPPKDNSGRNERGQFTGSGQGEQKPEANKAPAPPVETFEVKVNGKVRKMTRDELIRSAQLAEAAHERFEQAAQKERQAQQIIERAKKNPIEALRDPALGLSQEQIREAVEAWYAKEFIEPETLTEEQRKLKAYEEELKRYKDQEAEAEKRRLAEEEEKLTAHQRETLQKQIIDALEANHLPRNKFTVSRIAFYMRQAALKGFEAPMDLIVSQVRKERSDLISDLAQSTSSYEQMVETFGEDFINRIRQEDLKRLREGRLKASGGAFVTEQGDSSEHSSREKIDMSEVQARLRKMRQGI
jgi:hypothetical protein